MADFNEFGFVLVVYVFHYASVIAASLVHEKLVYDFALMVVAPKIKGVLTNLHQNQGSFRLGSNRGFPVCLSKLLTLPTDKRWKYQRH